VRIASVTGGGTPALLRVESACTGAPNLLFISGNSGITDGAMGQFSPQVASTFHIDRRRIRDHPPTREFP